MKLIHDKDEMIFLVVPKDVPALMKFLEKRGYEPTLQSDNYTIQVKKPLESHDSLQDGWYQFTGYNRKLSRRRKKVSA